MARQSTDCRKEIENLRKEKSKAQAKHNLTEVAKISNELGQALRLQGCLEESIDEHLSELELRESVSDVLGQAVAHRFIGEIYAELKAFKDSFNHLDKYLSYSRQCCSLVEEQRAWATLGRTYLIQSETFDTPVKTRKSLTKAEDAFLKSLDICGSLEGDISSRELGQMKSRLHYNLGFVYDNGRELVKSAEQLMESITLSSTHNHDEDLYNAQSMLALTQLKMARNHWKEADKSASAALATAIHMKKRHLQAESLITRAKIKLQLRDFNASKKSLKKSHKLSSKDSRPAILELTQQVMKLENRQLKVSRSRDDEEKMKLMEKMADKAAAYQLLQLALDLYTQTLKLAKELHEPASVIGPLYFSIGQTLFEDNQYDKAVAYFRKELECQYDQPTKACRTLLRIAEEQKNSSKKYESILETFREAEVRAEEAMHQKLQVRCKLYLVQLQELHGLEADSTDLNALCDKFNIDVNDLSDDEDSEDFEEQNDGNESESDIEFDWDDISDSDCEEEYDRSTQGTGRRQSRSFQVKKNDKGESQLHTACIHGQTRKVETLLQKGHPLNVHDFAGWTPLHEACNHGFLEIVNILLSHGADINDPGGPETDGITPLHDACYGGNPDVVEFLVGRGANVHKLDKEGRKAYDSLSAFCEKSDPQQLSSDQIRSLQHCQALIYRKMTEKELSPPDWFITVDDDLPTLSTNQRSARRRKRGRSNSPDPIDVVISSDEENNYNHFPPVNSPSNEDITNVDNVRNVYNTAIQSVGSSAQRLTLNKTVDSSKLKRSKPQSALVADDEVGDDWLIEDIKDPIKRRAPDLDRLFNSTSSKKRKTEDSERKLEKNKHCQKKTNPSIIKEKFNHFHSGTDSLNANNHLSNDDISFWNIFDDDIVDPSSVKSNARTENQSRITQFTESVASSASSSGYLSSCGRTGGSVYSSGNEISDVGCRQRSGTGNRGIGDSHAGAWRLKIRVQGELMMVPVIEHDQTRIVSWLCEQTADRYCRHIGRRPILNLQTIDGALLANDDVINVVIQPNEELAANFLGWSQRRLSSRYQDACISNTSVYYKNIQSRLDACTRTGVLNLSNLSMSGSTLQSVLTALKHQTHLREVHLNGNRLGDDILEELVSTLNTCSVRILDLSCNKITSVGLSTLVSGFRTNINPSNLRSLKLSYNRLSDDCCLSIIELLTSSPALEILELRHCQLTVAFLHNHRPALEGAFIRSVLERLDISCNRLGELGLRALMDTARSPQLRLLDISRTTIDGQHVLGLADKLTELLSEENCSLESLNVSGCNLTRDDLIALINALPRSKTMKSLFLTSNVHLDSPLITQLLDDSLDSPLSHLYIDGCGLSGAIESDLMNSFISKVSSNHPLKTFAFTCPRLESIDLNSLVQIWETRWQDKARSMVKEDYVKLHVD